MRDLRFKLELLNDIIQMLRQFRVIGKLVYEGEVAPIDCLVCLRLAIACIHGKKQYFGLVKNRYGVVRSERLSIDIFINECYL